MSVNHVVVDGSNIATEGRTLPSLKQLDEAVRAFIEQYEPGKVTVIVDASFPNRIDPSERATYEEAILAGEMVTPPAGVIGRGDAFLLQIADRADAVVLSNDSFQEFHGQFQWLFDQGRLIGGKPVPHVGWVFMERAPVRGPASRRAVSDAKKAKRKATVASSDAAAPEGAAPTTRSRRRRKAEQTPVEKAPVAGEAKPVRRGRRADKAAPDKTAPAKAAPDKAAPAKAAPAQAADLVADGGRRRRRRTGSPQEVQPYNEALPFIEFVAAHPVGSTVQGEIEQFSSHGAYVLADGTRCYLPLKHMADPPPRSAREMMQLGEQYTFEVHAFDTPRRGIDLAIPGVVPTPEPEPAVTPEPVPEPVTAGDPVDQPTEEERVAPAKKRSAAKKASAKKATAKKAAARKSTTRKAATKKAAAKKSTARKSTARKSTAKKSTAKKAAAKKSTAKKAAARKSTAKKSTAKKAAARKSTAKKGAAKKSRR
jgi:hypothetical protein